MLGQSYKTHVGPPTVDLHLCFSSIFRDFGPTRSFHVVLSRFCSFLPFDSLLYSCTHVLILITFLLVMNLKFLFLGFWDFWDFANFCRKI